MYQMDSVTSAYCHLSDVREAAAREKGQLSITDHVMEVVRAESNLRRAESEQRDYFREVIRRRINESSTRILNP